jgi:predicted GNAT family N-acyltransferase
MMLKKTCMPGQVCVSKKHRRQGIASRMVQAYVTMVQHTLPRIQALRLICKEDLVGLYSRAGFQFVGPSDVQHGRDIWLEMVLDLSDDDAANVDSEPNGTGAFLANGS